MKSLLVVLMTVIVLSITFTFVHVYAQSLTGKVPKGYKPVEARISSVESNDQLWTDRIITDLKIWKNIKDGKILLRFKCINHPMYCFMVRLFDENGNYLSHFVTERLCDVLGYPTEDDLERAHQILLYSISDSNKPVVERELVYSVNVRDLRDTEIICLGLVHVK